MGSRGLPFPTSNNAPLPIPGGYGGNYSGLNFGSTTGQPFPSFPQYGGYAMPATGGPSYNVGSFGTGQGLAGLNSAIVPGYSGAGVGLYNDLGKAYGKGTGAILGDLLSGKLFNPQVAAAFLNAQQPGIARGEAGILGAFGDAGARFSSAAALGLGDYESQVQLNQQQTLASLFQNAQSQELSLLSSLLPTLHQERADSGGWINKLLGGLEVAGGAALLPFSGGASLPLMGMGLNTLGHSSGGGGNPSASPMMFPGMLPGYGGNTGTFGTNAPLFSGSLSLPMSGPPPLTLDQVMQQSGGGLFGGDMSSFGGGSNEAPLPIPFY